MAFKKSARKTTAAEQNHTAPKCANGHDLGPRGGCYVSGCAHQYKPGQYWGR